MAHRKRIEGSVGLAEFRPNAKLRNKPKQSVTPFVFGGTISPSEGIEFVPGLRFAFAGGLSFDASCRLAADLGFAGYDLIGPQYWPTLRKYNLVPSLSHVGSAGTPFAGIGSKVHHSRFEATTRSALQECAANGVPNVIALSGPRGSMTYDEGVDNCVAFFNRVKATAEDLGVTICLEHLNSKVDHPGYLLDHVAAALDVVKRANSPRVKLLFDIYHAQIQDGDIVRTIRENIQWIGHIHASGNPGREQIDDDTQELNYGFIARAIAELSFSSYIGHEYTPAKGRDPVACLKQAFEIFDTSSGDGP